MVVLILEGGESFGGFLFWRSYGHIWIEKNNRCIESKGENVEWVVGKVIYGIVSWAFVLMLYKAFWSPSSDAGCRQ